MNNGRDDHIDALCNKIEGLEIALRSRTEQLAKARAENSVLKRKIETLCVDAEIGAFLQSEIKAMCESAGIDMSGTPPMMYPEAIMRMVSDTSSDNADALLVAYQHGRADGKKDANTKS